jgi:hypothetical protein
MGNTTPDLKEEIDMATTSKKAPRPGMVGVKFEPKSDSLLNELLAYLYRAYEFDGNDFLVETVERETLRAAMGEAKTLSGALWAVREKLHSQEVGAYRDEIMGTAW